MRRVALSLAMMSASLGVIGQQQTKTVANEEGKQSTCGLSFSWVLASRSAASSMLTAYRRDRTPTYTAPSLMHLLSRQQLTSGFRIVRARIN